MSSICNLEVLEETLSYLDFAWKKGSAFCQKLIRVIVALKISYPTLIFIRVDEQDVNKTADELYSHETTIVAEIEEGENESIVSSIYLEEILAKAREVRCPNKVKKGKTESNCWKAAIEACGIEEKPNYRKIYKEEGFKTSDQSIYWW